jgi:hypothetical protein
MYDHILHQLELELQPQLEPFRCNVRILSSFSSNQDSHLIVVYFLASHCTIFLDFKKDFVLILINSKQQEHRMLL